MLLLLLQQQPLLHMCVCAVFKDSPSVCPSQAAAIASSLMSQSHNYCHSLRTLLRSCPFILLLITYGTVSHCLDIVIGGVTFCGS